MFPLFKYVTGQHGPGPPTRKTNTNINCSSSWSQTVKNMVFFDAPPPKKKTAWLLLVLYSLGLNKNVKARNLENVAIYLWLSQLQLTKGSQDPSLSKQLSRSWGSSYLEVEEAAISKLSKQLSRSPDIIPPPPHSCGKVHRCQIGAVRTASEQNSNSQSYFSLMQGRAPLIIVFRFTPIVKLLR